MRGLPRLLAALALVLAWPLLALAQETRAIDYDAWQTVAGRAEAVLGAGAASDDTLVDLRAELAGWRDGLLAAQDANAARIETLEAQIAALGPLPEEGAEEPAEIAERRAELSERLDRLRMPKRTAEEAYSLAGGLIAEIDADLRARQAQALLRVGPSPLNPMNWGRAVAAVTDAAEKLMAEPRAAWAGWTERLGAGLLAVAVLALVGLLLMARARGWMRPLMRQAEERLPPRAHGGAVFAISLGQIVLPVLGALALAQAGRLSGLAGPTWAALLGALPLAALNYYGARWIASWLFPIGDYWNVNLGLPKAARREGRAHARVLGTLFALLVFIGALAEPGRWSEATRVVLALLPLIAIGLTLFRLGQLLAKHAGHRPGEAAEGDGEGAPAEDGYAGRLLRLTGMLCMIAGAVGPVLALVGLAAAARHLLIPSAVSLALIGLLVILQQLVRDLYALVRRRDDGARDALAPVLIGFALTLAALPVFALIWGARVSDLTEIWARVRKGATIGETVISPGAVIAALVLFAIGFAVTRLVQGALRAQVLPRTRIDPGGRVAIVSGVGYIGIFVAALVAIIGAGFDLSSLAIVAGALSVGIGFGLQNIVSNFVSGIILLIERPIGEGDWIEVGGKMGYVRSISVRSTRIETFDRTDVIVPNADFISGTVTNWTRGNLIGRLTLPVGVAYGTDTRLVERVLREVAEAHPMVILKPPPAVLFRNFGPDSLEFEIRAILRDVNWLLSVQNDMNHDIARRFQEEGIEIPFAQRDIWLRNPEALRGAGTGERPGDASAA